MNEQPSPEFEKELREMLGAPNANPIFVRDLRATLIERSTMKQNNRFLPRLAWGFALAVLMALLVVASPRAATLLKHWLGYVPGVGFVRSDESLRVLSAPVTLEKDGLRMTIESGTADPQRTILLQRITGYRGPDGSLPTSGRFCQTPAQLVLPDGTVVQELSYETSWDGDDPGHTTYMGRYTFNALPAGVTDVVLEIPCALSDSAYTDYELALHFEIADSTQVLPVIELPTPLPSQPVTGSVSPAAASIDGFTIVLESETSLDDGYILTGHFAWTDPRFDGFSAYPSNVQVTDANGEQLNIEPVDPGVTNTDPAIKELPFAYRVPGKDHAFPLTMTVSEVVVNLPDTATFQFDFGANPQIGQAWNANIDVSIAGHVIHVQTIELTSGRTPTELGFTFTLTSDPQITGASVVDANPEIVPVSGGGGGGGGSGGMDAGIAVGPIIYGWAIDGYVPAGLKTFVVSDLAITYTDTWQTSWTPTQP